MTIHARLDDAARCAEAGALATAFAAAVAATPAATRRAAPPTARRRAWPVPELLGRRAWPVVAQLRSPPKPGWPRVGPRSATTAAAAAAVAATPTGAGKGRKAAVPAVHALLNAVERVVAPTAAVEAGEVLRPTMVRAAVHMAEAAAQQAAHLAQIKLPRI